MYEYLVENLINYSQVEGNLRRTADRGLISELYRKQMNALALKYFGVDSNDNYTDNKEEIVSYRCPYSGEIIKDLSEAHLEHILPVSSNGGTVLFNCIPIFDKINLSKSDEPNLLVWWQGKGQEYFDYDRLERLIQYMLEGYTLAFKEPIEEYAYDYDNSLNNDDYIENDDLSIDLKAKASIKFNTNIQQNITYYQLISDLISELSKDRDVSKYNSQLNNLKEHHTFGNIEELEKVIKAIQTVFKETLGDNSKKYLSYSLKIDMTKLLKSLKTNDYENEIRKRLKLIEQLLANNEKQIEDFFESLQDIEEDNLLYCDNPSHEQINWFINNLKVSHKSKIKMFIEMISDKKYTSYTINNSGKFVPDFNNVFKAGSNIPFKGLDNNNLEIGFFWNNNFYEIETTINEKMKKLISIKDKSLYENEEYLKLLRAQRAIDDYKFQCDSGLNLRIDCFIEMLSKSKFTGYIDGKADENNIFVKRNKIPFKNYEHLIGLNTSNFWITHSVEIEERINHRLNILYDINNRSPIEEQELNNLLNAVKEIKKYKFQCDSGIDLRINCFIEMLSESKYTGYIDGKADENNIFRAVSTVRFVGYESIDGLTTSGFWNSNSQRIKYVIERKIEELEKIENRTIAQQQMYDKLAIAKKSINNYEFQCDSGIDLRIDCFIEMLSESKYTGYIDGKADENNIFRIESKVPFKGYEDINGLNTGWFWNGHSIEIENTIISKIERLESIGNRAIEDEARLEKLKKSLKAVMNYKFYSKNSGLPMRIDCFIDMLSDKRYIEYENGHPTQNNIFNYYNKIPFKGYEDINGLFTEQFWFHNSDKIENVINARLNKIKNKENKNEQDNKEYNKLLVAKKEIEKYKFQMDSNLYDRIDCFIQMLCDEKYTNFENGKPDINNIFKVDNKIPFKGYEEIIGLDTNHFWSNNSNSIIIPLIFFNKKYDKKEKQYVDSEKNYLSAEYDKARTAILKYLSLKDKTVYSSIEQYINNLAKKEIKVEKVIKLIKLRNELIKKRDILIVENENHINAINHNTNTRKAI